MDHLHFTQEEHLGQLSIQRPEKLNALNTAVLRELQDFLMIHTQRKELRALIITGAGDKAFVAGADIKEMQTLDHMEMLELCKLGQRVTRMLETAPFATLAAVNGFALGGGLELALACDFIYASDRARLGLPEVTLGIIPGFGGTQRLARAAGSRQAKELVMSGKMISADEALRIGIVNRVCPHENLLEESRKTATAIAQNPLSATMQAKSVIVHGADMSLVDGLALERNACAVCFATPDREEGMQAFVEKRQPQFA